MAELSIEQGKFSGGMLGPKGMYRDSAARAKSVKRIENGVVRYEGSIGNRDRIKLDTADNISLITRSDLRTLPLRVGDRALTLVYSPWHHLNIRHEPAEPPFDHSFNQEIPETYGLDTYSASGHPGLPEGINAIKKFLRNPPLEMGELYDLKVYNTDTQRNILIDYATSSMIYNVFSIYEGGNVIVAERSHMIRTTGNQGVIFSRVYSDFPGIQTWNWSRVYGVMQDNYRGYRADGTGTFGEGSVADRFFNVSYRAIALEDKVLIYDEQGTTDPLVLSYFGEGWQLTPLQGGTQRYIPVTMRVSVGQIPPVPTIEAPRGLFVSSELSDEEQTSLTQDNARNRLVLEAHRGEQESRQGPLMYGLPDASEDGVADSLVREKSLVVGSIRAAAPHGVSGSFPFISVYLRTGSENFSVFILPDRIFNDFVGQFTIAPRDALPTGLSWSSVSNTFHVASTWSGAAVISFTVEEGNNFNISLLRTAETELNKTVRASLVYDVSSFIVNLPTVYSGTYDSYGLEMTASDGFLSSVFVSRSNIVSLADVGLRLGTGSTTILEIDPDSDVSVSERVALLSSSQKYLYVEGVRGNMVIDRGVIPLSLYDNRLSSFYWHGLEQIVQQTSSNSFAYRTALVDGAPNIGSPNITDRQTAILTGLSGSDVTFATSGDDIYQNLAREMKQAYRLVNKGIPTIWAHYQGRLLWFEKFLNGVSALIDFRRVPSFNYNKDSPLTTDAFFQLLPQSDNSQGIDWAEEYEGNLLIGQKGQIRFFNFGAPFKRESFVPNVLSNFDSGGIPPVRVRNFLFKVDGTAKNIERLETQFVYQSQYIAVTVGQKLYIDYLSQSRVVQLVAHPEEHALYVVLESGRVFYGYVFSDGTVGWSELKFPGFVEGARFLRTSRGILYYTSEGSRFIFHRDTLYATEESRLVTKVELLPIALMKESNESYLEQQGRTIRASIIVDMPEGEELLVGSGDEVVSMLTYQGEELTEHVADPGDGRDGILIQYEGDGDFSLINVDSNVQSPEAVKRK